MRGVEALDRDVPGSPSWAVALAQEQRLLLRALRPADVVEVAASVERMPQKASYFWPKAATGLVFHALD